MLADGFQRLADASAAAADAAAKKAAEPPVPPPAPEKPADAASAPAALRPAPRTQHPAPIHPCLRLANSAQRASLARDDPSGHAEWSHAGQSLPSRRRDWS